MTHKSSNSIDSINSNLQEDVNIVLHWCKQNNMILNETKTKGILIGTPQRQARCQSNLDVTVDNHKIECSETEKTAGNTHRSMS